MQTVLKHHKFLSMCLKNLTEINEADKNDSGHTLLSMMVVHKQGTEKRAVEHQRARAVMDINGTHLSECGVW